MVFVGTSHPEKGSPFISQGLGGLLLGIILCVLCTPQFYSVEHVLMGSLATPLSAESVQGYLGGFRCQSFESQCSISGYRWFKYPTVVIVVDFLEF